jgi:hypothetical protein
LGLTRIRRATGFFPPLHVAAIGKIGKLTGGDDDENKTNSIRGRGDVGIGRIMG